MHVLRRDAGGEYKNVELFCHDAGVTRQITERMHRTVMNIVRCMIFSCDLPLSFRGDAAEYCAYVLYRMPPRSNPNRVSPITILTGRQPSLVDIVVLESPCQTHSDSQKNSLKQRYSQESIVGKSDETIGLRDWLPSDRIVIETRHVRRVATLNDEVNAQLRDVLHNGTENELAEFEHTRQAGHLDQSEENR